VTLDRPLRVDRVGTDRFRVDGTPTDCVHLGVERLTGVAPRLVVSGINRGLNLGDDVTYSGTVAGALEGTLLGIPSIAVSAATDASGRASYGHAAAIARYVAEQVLARGLGSGVLLNVNVPAGRPRGLRVTRQGSRIYRATAEERTDPAGRPYYWIAGTDATPAGEADGDHRALADGCVSVTPLQANLTDERALGALGGWALCLPALEPLA
jgi:5'-nucleotidase